MSRPGGEGSSPLQRATLAALAQGGALAAADAHHVERREQLEMANAVAASGGRAASFVERSPQIGGRRAH